MYGSGLFNFGSYVSFPNLFTFFLGLDVPTSSFIFIENVFDYSFYDYDLNGKQQISCLTETPAPLTINALSRILFPLSYT